MVRLGQACTGRTSLHVAGESAMLRQKSDHALERERTLAEGVREVATELRLVDVVDLVTYVRTEQYANIGDLINSAIELYFRPGTLSYGEAGDVLLDWSGAPEVKLDMAFRHPRVSVHFCLALAAQHGAVEINYISFTNPSADPSANTACLAAALADARLPARLSAAAA